MEEEVVQKMNYGLMFQISFEAIPLLVNSEMTCQGVPSVLTGACALPFVHT